MTAEPPVGASDHGKVLVIGARGFTGRQVVAAIESASSGSCVSGHAVYGSPIGSVRETDDLTGRLSAYGADKLESESILRQTASEDLHVTLVRPALVHGRGGEEWFDRFVTRNRLTVLRDLGASDEGDAHVVHFHDLADLCAHPLSDRLPRSRSQTSSTTASAASTATSRCRRWPPALGAPPPGGASLGLGIRSHRASGSRSACST